MGTLDNGWGQGWDNMGPALLSLCPGLSIQSQSPESVVVTTPPGPHPWEAVREREHWWEKALKCWIPCIYPIPMGLPHVYINWTFYLSIGLWFSFRSLQMFFNCCNCKILNVIKSKGLKRKKTKAIQSSKASKSKSHEIHVSNMQRSSGLMRKKSDVAWKDQTCKGRCE